MSGSKISENTSTSANNDSKHYNMRQFINTSKNYTKNKTEDTLNLSNRHLQLLSVTIDLSTFDPHTSIVSEFFVNLYQFLLNVEQRSAWYCVNVLTVACQNPAARSALIHTYQFLPLLAPLLSDQLPTEKRIKLLNLMQELSCGIKISWQIPHLPHLMSTLIRWIESNKEEEVVTLSLGILVNLCYKNLPAIYTLYRQVDIKKFLRMCMPLEGAKTEMHVCKLLMILDCLNETIPTAVILKFVGVTFKSLVGAFIMNDVVQLRHITEFFSDICQHKTYAKIILKFDNYPKELDNLLQVIEKSGRSGSSDSGDCGTECMALLFDFFHFFIERLENLTFLYSRLINVAWKWVQYDSASSSALTILRTIALNTTEDDSAALEPLLSDLPIFLLALDNSDGLAINIASNKRLTAFLELLRALLQTNSTRNRVLHVLHERFLLNIFMPLVGNQGESRMQASTVDNFSPDAVLLYVNAIALIDEMVTYKPEWITLYINLMQQKQIHMVLTHALYGGSKEIKALIMRMSSKPAFPADKVAATMSELQPLTQIDSNVNNCTNNQQIANNFCFPLISVTQLERVDEVIDKLKEAREQHSQYINISTSDVMELYEYKLTTMSYSEQAATASLEAASQRCTHLQHRIAQLTTELSRLHQLLSHAQQTHEDTTKMKDMVIENNKQLQQWADSQIAIKDKKLHEKTELLEETTKHLKKLESTLPILEEKNNELKKFVTKLEENLNKKEKLVQKKDEQLTASNAENKHLKLQLTQSEEKARHIEAELHATTRKLAEVSENYQNCKQILGTITQLTTSQYAK